MDYFKLDKKVRVLMYCYLWELPPEQHYSFFMKMNDHHYWFNNCTEDKSFYYKRAQKYLRKDKIHRIKDKMNGIH